MQADLAGVSQRHQLNRRQSAAFTLVELLVVIAIIGVLVAMLLPSLKKARQASVRVACLSNLHQIAVAAIMYGNDNQGYVPGVAGFWQRDYTYYAQSIDSGFGYPDGPVGLGLLYARGYCKNGQVFYCPGRTESERLSASWGGSGGIWPWSGFGQPGSGFIEASYFMATSNISTNENLRYGGWHRFGKTNHTKPLAFDYCLKLSDPDSGFSTWMPWGANRHRHGQGYNFAFFDGSCRYVEDDLRDGAIEVAYTHFDDIPWIYADSNFIYYIHTKWFGWTDHTRP